jgi:lysophospholipase L1-like esterase
VASHPRAVILSPFVSKRSFLPLLALGATLSACGGGDNGGSGPTPVQSSGPTFNVMGAVFYDENGNGTLDAGENVRVPDVTVQIGTATGRTSKVLGEFTVPGVPQGTQTVTLSRTTLPPFYAAPATVTVTVPQSQGLLIPVTLPIGTNRPNVYMGFGDSITIGEGSPDNRGYRPGLEERLAGFFGRGSVTVDGIDATRSSRGADRIDDSLNRTRPAYTLILYGTNDFNVLDCKVNPPCFTIDSLRNIALSARGSRSLPILSTIIPANPNAALQPDRNMWVAAMNVRIRALGREMGVPVADPEPLFLKDPNFDRLYTDHVHPNNGGYDHIAEAFFAAIIIPTPTTTLSAPTIPAPALFTRPTSLRPTRATAARPAIVEAGSRE